MICSSGGPAADALGPAGHPVAAGGGYDGLGGDAELGGDAGVGAAGVLVAEPLRVDGAGPRHATTISRAGNSAFWQRVPSCTHCEWPTPDATLGCPGQPPSSHAS